MIFTIYRFPAGNDSTLGLLVADVKGVPSILCYTLEDLPQKVKIRGETRIPAGVYRLGVRREGKMNDEYLRKFPKMHKGMIWILDVPEFEFVYIHILNKAIESLGCIGVGDVVNNNAIPGAFGFLGDSTDAYRRLYPVILDAINSPEGATLRILDFGRGR